MGVEPPFIYDRPSAYSFNGPTDRGFNPKAVTHSSWSPPARSAPKKDGPLIEFNKHPDSYLIVPYGNLNVKPMNPNTKSKVKKIRGAQLFLRVCGLLGALGLLFCAISINKTSGSVSWMIRVAPAVALVHTVYAVYHLSRNVLGRTAASTASYMLFACMIDTGLIPFLVFSALITHSDYTGNAYGWNTLFNIDDISYKIIYAFFLLNVAEGALMAISLVFGIYLATLFRKIAKLPPDMNPLEPSLTARPHHKRNKSEMTSEKSPNGKAGSRISNTSDPNIAGTRRVPFMHTRTDSADSVTLYGNNSARNSKTALLQKEENNYRRSQQSFVEGVSRPVSAVNPATNSRPAGSGLDYEESRSATTPKERSKKTSSWLSYMKSADYEGTYRNVSGYSAVMLNEEVPHPAPVSQQHPDRQTQEPVYDEGRNWYETPAHHSHTDLLDQASCHVPKPLSILDEESESLAPPSLGQSKKRSREPLGMNPPTPRNAQFASTPDDSFDARTPESPQRHPLQSTDPNVAGRPQQNSRPSSFVGSGTKSRFYGDLRRSISSLSQHDDENFELHGEVSDDEDRPQTSESSHIQVYSVEEDEETENHMRTYQEQQKKFQQQWNGERQASNSTGYDLNGGYAGLGSEFGRGMGRRREVSGKIAEEGRSPGYGGVGQSEREIGLETGQANRGGAAGWARFKGL